MSIFKTEEEQVDDLKRWLRSYGPSILIGLILALGIIYGKQFWQKHTLHQAQKASTLYSDMEAAYTDQNTASMAKLAHSLHRDFAKSPYAQYASFLQTKVAVDHLHYDEAEKVLQQIIDHSKDDNLVAIATLRLARVNIANNKAKEALALLKKINNKHYTGLAEVVKGDAYIELHENDNARKAYQTALDTIPNADSIMPTLRIRLENVGNGE